MSAFRRALDEGADGVEIDIRRTADQQWIVHHNADINTRGDNTPIASLTLKESQRLTTGTDGDFVPSLRTVLAWARGGSCTLILDVKDSGAVSELVETVEDAKLTTPPVISAFSKSVLSEIARVRPAWPFALIIGDPLFRWARRLMFGSILRWAERHSLAALHMQERWVTAGTVEAIHDLGIRVGVWTVDDPLRMTLLSALGVDAIITNRPDLGRAAVDGQQTQHIMTEPNS